MDIIGTIICFALTCFAFICAVYGCKFLQRSAPQDKNSVLSTMVGLWGIGLVLAGITFAMTDSAFSEAWESYTAMAMEAFLWLIAIVISIKNI